MILAHRIELRPSKAQRDYFKHAADCARFVYNYARAQMESLYEQGKKPNPMQLKKAFNQIKYEKYSFLRDVHRDCHSQPFFDLNAAYQNFFKKRAKYPKFKKKGIAKNSFYVAGDKLAADGMMVRIPKIGWVRMREELRFSGKLVGARVSERADRWFISIQVECIPTVKPRISGGRVGIDLGIKTTATLSDGSSYNSPKPLRHLLKRLRRAQKALSRKQKGSKNRTKAKYHIAKISYRISNIRQDFIHKMTTEIVRKNQAIAIEDLAVENMLKNHKLSRCLSDESFREIRRQLEYKSVLYGSALIVVDRFFPSSKLCHKCGWKNDALTLKQRTFHCNQCGETVDRDLNAAYNLFNQLPEAIGEVKPVDRIDSVVLATTVRDEAGISKDLHECVSRK